MQIHFGPEKSPSMFRHFHLKFALAGVDTVPVFGVFISFVTVCVGEQYG